MDDSAADTEKVKEHRRLQNDSWDDDENASLSVGNDKKNEWDDDDSTRVIDKAGKKPRRNRWDDATQETNNLFGDDDDDAKDAKESEQMGRDTEK